MTGEKRQVDAATEQPVAPRNVVVMKVPFSALAYQNPSKGRLGAKLVGTGAAWIATNGTTIEGTWRKRDATAPTHHCWSSIPTRTPPRLN